MVNDPKKDVIDQIKSVINSYANNPNLSDSRKGEIGLLKDKLDLITVCPCSDGVEVKEVKSLEKKERKPNKRAEYMGLCMRAAAKGGEGKDMKTCSDNYKQIKEKEKVND